MSDIKFTLTQSQESGLKRRRPPGLLSIPPTKLYKPSEAASGLYRNQSPVLQNTASVKQATVLLGAVRY